jgi:hypothetical protein
MISRGSISLSVIFGTPENYHTDSVIFDVVEVNLPFNVILGRPTLYRFMVVAHYGYLVLKMPSPNNIIKICGDRSAGTFALEKFQALAVAQKDVAGHDEQDQAPLSSHMCDSASAPRVQPSDNEDIPMKVIQIGTDAAQTICIMENLGDN